MLDYDAYYSAADAAEAAGEHGRAATAHFGILADALSYPRGRDGRTMQLPADLRLMLADFLIKHGWRWHPEHATIKRRSCAGPGTYDDAVQWVALDAPDDPLDNLDTMTLADVAQLPPELRARALERLGMAGPPATEPGASPWQAANTVTIVEEPDDSADRQPWQ
jgi:hypothetical protein